MPIDDALQELKKEITAPVKTQPNTDSLAYIKQETDKELWEICNALDKKLKDFLTSAIDLNGSFNKAFELGKDSEQADSSRAIKFRIENNTELNNKSAGFSISRKVSVPEKYFEYISISHSRWNKFKKVETKRIPRKIFGISFGEEVIYDEVFDCEIKSFYYSWERKVLARPNSVCGEDHCSTAWETKMLPEQIPGLCSQQNCFDRTQVYAKSESQGFFQTLIDLYYRDPRATRAILRMLNQAPDVIHNYFSELRDSSKEFKV